MLWNERPGLETRSEIFRPNATRISKNSWMSTETSKFRNVGRWSIFSNFVKDRNVLGTCDSDAGVKIFIPSNQRTLILILKGNGSLAGLTSYPYRINLLGISCICWCRICFCLRPSAKDQGITWVVVLVLLVVLLLLVHFLFKRNLSEK